jgi:hypothetical protein
MDDQTLDMELARRRDETIVEAAGSLLLAELVITSRGAAAASGGVPARRRLSRRTRVGWSVGGFVLVGVLAAGVTFQDYLLTIPPFAGLMDGEQRTMTGWIMTPEYGDDAGEECVLYPEFRQLSTAQFNTISQFVLAEARWESLGVQVAQISDLSPGETAPESADPTYYDALATVVHERVQEALPDIPFRARFTVKDGLATDPPSFEGYTTVCPPGLADDQ